MTKIYKGKVMRFEHCPSCGGWLDTGGGGEMKSDRTAGEEKIYHDVEGNERTLHEMLRVEPEWAVNKIKQGEKAVNNLERMMEALKRIEMDGFDMCAHIARTALAELEEE